MEITQPVEQAKKKWLKAEDVFKVATCLVVAMWSICLKYFFEFRQYLEKQKLDYFEFKYSWYILVGFLFMITTKYGYYALARNFVDKKVLNEKYEGDSRRRKLESFLKLSYDSVFYLSTSAAAFILFREEPWFPSWAGGCGKCENIYLNYPGIPSAKKDELQMFYALQLGVHIFSVFEMVVIKRKNELKYYEQLLHHILAASLIAFSAMANEILIGVMVLFTHDASDIFMAFGRTYVETKFKKHWFVGIPIVFMLLFTWIYMRLVVFPFCIIGNIHLAYPSPGDSYHMVYYPHALLHLKLLVLVCMHIYWTYHLIRSIFLSLKKKSFGNHHETGKEKNKPVVSEVPS